MARDAMYFLRGPDWLHANEGLGEKQTRFYTTKCVLSADSPAGISTMALHGTADADQAILFMSQVRPSTSAALAATNLPRWRAACPQ
eukprot:4083821-Pleurochrysis_carterae.AAC.1